MSLQPDGGEQTEPRQKRRPQGELEEWADNRQANEPGEQPQDRRWQVDQHPVKQHPGHPKETDQALAERLEADEGHPEKCSRGIAHRVAKEHFEMGAVVFSIIDGSRLVVARFHDFNGEPPW